MTFLELVGVVAIFAVTTRVVIGIAWILFGQEHAEGD